MGDAKAPAAAGAGYTANLQKMDVSAGLDEGMLKGQIAEAAKGLIGYDEDIEFDMPLMESGLTSNAAVVLRDALTQQLPGVNLPVTLVFDYPSISAMSELIMLGFQALAGLNPLRWSGETTFNRAITHLCKVQNRPIILKVPANTLGQELYFNTKEDAIVHLMNLHLALIGMATTNDGLGKRATDAALWVRSADPAPTNPLTVETIRVDAGSRYPTTSVTAEAIRVGASPRIPTNTVSAETVRVAAGSRIPTTSVSAEPVRIAASPRNPTVTMVR